MAERPPPPGAPDDTGGAPTPVPLPPRYRFEAALGEGGLGTVVRAYDSQLRVSVAIKTIRHALAAADPQRYDYFRARFEREAIAGARVRSSPYIVTVYDQLVGASGDLFLVLEYVPGGTLRDRLVGGPLPPDAALRLIADAARGLLALHEADMVHRDIKPENIFVAADGRAMVGDLGIVQMSTTTFRTRLEYGSPQGHPGTPLYMSPEQATSTDALTPEADQYSLGAVLFELVTAKRYKNVYADEREALQAGLPPGLAALIRRMTDADPARRYRGMGAVLEAIAAIDLSGPPAAYPATVPDAPQQQTWPQAETWPQTPRVDLRPAPPPPTPAPPRPVSRRALLAGVGGIVVAGGAAGGAWALTHRTPADVSPTATTAPTASAIVATATLTRASATPTPSAPTLTSTASAIATVGTATPSAGATTTGAASGTIVPLGVLLPLSGASGALGASAKSGAEVAAKYFNDRGGVGGQPIQIVSEDTAGNPTTAVTALQKLTGTFKVVGVVGPLLSSEVAAVQGTVDSQKVPCIAIGTGGIVVYIRSAYLVSFNANYDVNADTAANRTFKAAYQAQAGKAPDQFAAQAFSAVQVFVEALRAAGTTINLAVVATDDLHTKLNAQIRAGTYTTPLGPISFR